MRYRGGSFVKCLGDALLHADPENTLKIRNAFPEYWDEYLEIYTKDHALHETDGCSRHSPI